MSKSEREEVMTKLTITLSIKFRDEMEAICEQYTKEHGILVNQIIFNFEQIESSKDVRMRQHGMGYVCTPEDAVETDLIENGETHDFCSVCEKCRPFERRKANEKM